MSRHKKCIKAEKDALDRMRARREREEKKRRKAVSVATLQATK